MAKDRFDLETEICQISNYSKDIRSIVCKIKDVINLDSVPNSSTRAIRLCLNALDGVATLIDIHEDAIYETYKDCFHLDGSSQTVVIRQKYFPFYFDGGFSD